MQNAIVAGIDVSKRHSDMCVLAPDNSIIVRLHFVHDVNGLKEVCRVLHSLEKEYGSAAVIMESTGHYHRLPQYFLVKHGFQVIIINPLQSNAIKNIGVRKTKNDKVDAYRIALLYRLKKFNPTNLPQDTLYDLRVLCRQYAVMTGHHTMYTNKLTGILDQSFPGFSKLWSKVTLRTPLEVLSHYPNPQSVLDAPEEDIYTLIRNTSRSGHAYALAKTMELKTLASDVLVLSINYESHNIIIQTLISMLRTIQDNLADLLKKIDQLAHKDPTIQNNIALLDSIPGISPFGAAVILSEIGDSTAFRKPTQLAAFFGLDPSQRQSGEFMSTKNKISKRGCRYVRRILAMIALSCVSEIRGQATNPVLAEFYKKKCETKPTKVAICAVMHKLVYIIFAVLRDQTPFELRTPEEHARRLKVQSPDKHVA